LEKKNNTSISVIVPLLNEEESLEELHEKLFNVLKKLDVNYEIIYIDDGSTDNSLDVLKKICEVDNKVEVISFQKNYGKSAALSTGFDKARGDYIFTIDADLQDDPEEIFKILEKLKSGYDLISGWKKKRKDPLVKRFSSRFFNFVTAIISRIKIHDFNCGLKGYRKEVVKNINVYGELHRYIPVLAKEAGFTKIGEIPVKHHRRKYGKTKYGVSRFLNGFFDFLTVHYVFRYILKPLHFFGILGIICFLIGFGISLYLTILRLTGQGLSQRPLLFLGILLIILGIQFISTGFLGEMIVFSKKKENHYIIKEHINKKEEEK